MTKVAKYIHTTPIHNMSSPTIIVDELLKMYKPNSVIDFGCGLGNFLKAFKEKGITDVLGLDGNWVDKKMLSGCLENNEFVETNLELKYESTKKYDLAISLEVAEHLSKESAATFVENLVNASEVILFSAAIPLQGGQNHINEQWPQFWQKEFLKYNYVFFDVLREQIWDNSNVKWWYKQNAFLVIEKDNNLIKALALKEKQLYNYIHPELYIERCNEYINFRKGNFPIKVYFRLLIKSILLKLGIL